MIQNPAIQGGSGGSTYSIKDDFSLFPETAMAGEIVGTYESFEVGIPLPKVITDSGIQIPVSFADRPMRAPMQYPYFVMPAENVTISYG